MLHCVEDDLKYSGISKEGNAFFFKGLVDLQPTI
jgi:hypothetical protein